MDLAIQDSPLPGSPAAWLWNAYNTRTILGTELKVRVGGSFVWPPALYSVTAAAGPDGAPKQQPKRVVFVAGGIGVNPLVSMLAAIAEEEETRRKLEGAGDEPQRIEVNFLYSVRMADALAPMNGELASLEIEVEDDYDDDSEDEEEPRGPFAHKIPFLELIAGDIYGRKKVKGNFQLFLTGECDKDVREVVACNEIDVPYAARRMTVDDVRKALGFPEEWKDSVVYICGVPTMIDQFVEELTNPREGLAMARERVLYEKWW